MVAKSGVFLLVSLHTFLLTRLHADTDLLCFRIQQEGAPYGKETGTVPDGMRVGAREIAFAQTEVMDSIQHIGFSTAVGSGQGIGTRPEIEFRLRVVFEVEKCQSLQLHGAKVLGSGLARREYLALLKDENLINKQ